jgi:hypothetical protein
MCAVFDAEIAVVVASARRTTKDQPIVSSVQGLRVFSP